MVAWKAMFPGWLWDTFPLEQMTSLSLGVKSSERIVLSSVRLIMMLFVADVCCGLIFYEIYSLVSLFDL